MLLRLFILNFSNIEPTTVDRDGMIAHFFVQINFSLRIYSKLNKAPLQSKILNRLRKTNALLEDVNFCTAKTMKTRLRDFDKLFNTIFLTEFKKLRDKSCSFRRSFVMNGFNELLYYKEAENAFFKPKENKGLVFWRDMCLFGNSLVCFASTCNFIELSNSIIKFEKFYFRCVVNCTSFKEAKRKSWEVEEYCWARYRQGWT